MKRHVAILFAFLCLFVSTSAANAQSFVWAYIYPNPAQQPVVVMPGGTLGFRRNMQVIVTAYVYTNNLPDNSLQMTATWQFPSGPTVYGPFNAATGGLYQTFHPHIGMAAGDPTAINLTITFKGPMGQVPALTRTITFYRIP